jgi:hypothetical protein
MEWTGRLYLDDTIDVRRCPECGGKHPDHAKSCALKQEIGDRP